jgi:uncharacterized protein YfbU (UPF0304 family)
MISSKDRFTQKLASYVGLQLETDNVGRLITNRYDKRDDFFNSQLPLHQWQYSRITSVWSLHFTTHTLF